MSSSSSASAAAPAKSPSLSAVAKSDSEAVSIVSTSASSDDERGGASSSNVAAASDFKFNASAQEFTPFSLNPNAPEYTPKPRQPEPAVAMRTVAVQQPRAPFVAQPGQVVGVMAAAPLGMYPAGVPVMFRAPGMPYVTYAAAGPVSPSVNLTAYHENVSGPGAPEARAKGKAWGPRSQYQAAGRAQAKGYPAKGKPYEATAEEIAAATAVASAAVAKAAPWMVPPKNSEESPEEENEGGEKKKTWAAIARDSLPKPNVPVRVPTKAKAVASAAGHTFVAPKATAPRTSQAPASERLGNNEATSSSETSQVTGGVVETEAQHRSQKASVQASVVSSTATGNVAQVQQATSKPEEADEAKEDKDEEAEKKPKTWADRVRMTMSKKASAPQTPAKTNSVVSAAVPAPAVPKDTAWGPSKITVVTEVVEEVIEGAAQQVADKQKNMVADEAPESPLYPPPTEEDRKLSAKNHQVEVETSVDKAKMSKDAGVMLPGKTGVDRKTEKDARDDQKKVQEPVKEPSQQIVDQQHANIKEQKWPVRQVQQEVQKEQQQPAKDTSDSGEKDDEKEEEISPWLRAVKQKPDAKALQGGAWKAAPREKKVSGPVPSEVPTREVAWGPQAKAAVATAAPVKEVTWGPSAKVAPTAKVEIAKDDKPSEKEEKQEQKQEPIVEQKQDRNQDASPEREPDNSEVKLLATSKAAGKEKKVVGPVPVVAVPREVAWGPGAKAAQTKAAAPVSIKPASKPVPSRAQLAPQTAATDAWDAEAEDSKDAWNDEEPSKDAWDTPETKSAVQPPQAPAVEAEKEVATATQIDVANEAAEPAPTESVKSAPRKDEKKREASPRKQEFPPSATKEQTQSKSKSPTRSTAAKQEEQTQSKSKSPTRSTAAKQEETKPVPSKKEKLAPPPLPIAHRVVPRAIRTGSRLSYSVKLLKELRPSLADTEGMCPPSIPGPLRVTADEEAPGTDRKRYNMEFLKQFKDKPACHALPEKHSIPHELWRSSSGPNNSTTPSNRHRGRDDDDKDDWRAQGAKHQASQGRTPTGRDRRGRRAQEEDFKLEVSENSWGAQQKLKAKDDLSDEQIIRKMRGILNKLSVEKFDSLYVQLLECGIHSEEHVECLMKEVFEKATTQHHFIEMYTDLCLRLNKWFSEKEERERKENGSQDKEKDKAKQGFKRILLNQCQDSFETYLKPPQGLEHLSGDDLFEAQTKYKTTMLGNMKFVGQLLINKMLSSRIIFQCTEELLFHKTDESIETLCVFVRTIGPFFDTKDWSQHDRLLRVFKDMKALVEASGSKGIPPRLRCLVQDVLDMQKRGWERNEVLDRQPEGPKTLGEVKQQWTSDNLAAEKGASTPSHMRGRVEPARFDSRKFGEVDDSWETVPRKGMRTPMGTPHGASQPELLRGSSQPSPMSGNAFGALTKSRTPKSRTEENFVGRTPKGETGLPWKDKPVSAVSPSRKVTSKGAADSASESAENWRKEVDKIVSELALSHDLDEAMARMKECRWSIPRSRQKVELGRIVSDAVEKGNSAARVVLFNFLVQLCTKDMVHRRALAESVDAFIGELYEDLKVDIPKLPAIMRDELLPLLEREAGALQVSREDLESFRQRL